MCSLGAVRWRYVKSCLKKLWIFWRKFSTVIYLRFFTFWNLLSPYQFLFIYLRRGFRPPSGLPVSLLEGVFDFSSYYLCSWRHQYFMAPRREAIMCSYTQCPSFLHTPNVCIFSINPCAFYLKIVCTFCKMSTLNQTIFIFPGFFLHLGQFSPNHFLTKNLDAVGNVQPFFFRIFSAPFLSDFALFFPNELFWCIFIIVRFCAFTHIFFQGKLHSPPPLMYLYWFIHGLMDCMRFFTTEKNGMQNFRE